MQVPPLTHPTWIDLLTGMVRHRPSFLAARMFLAAVRVELLTGGNQPDAVRRHAADLRELFVQNSECRAVQQDLAKLFG